MKKLILITLVLTCVFGVLYFWCWQAGLLIRYSETSSGQPNSQSEQESTSLSAVNGDSSSGRPVISESPPVSSDGTASEMRAVWITQYELATIRAASESAFRAAFAALMQNCVSFKINTVFVQVRPNGDSFYPSDYYPWSYYISGAAGQSLSYDPLKVMIEEAHKLHLSFHAWINPYRLQTETQMKQVPDSYQTKQWYNERANSNRVVVLNGVCYLNPGEPDARAVILNGVKEIVSKYDVDGIHIDDYFYPTTDESFDKAAFSQYANGKSLSDFRFDSVNQTIKGIYSTIKSVKQSVVFGVSPAGNLANNKNSLYADVQKWASEDGYLDYLIPQLYWDYTHATLPFDKNVVTWNSIVTSAHVKLVPGLAAYKIANGSFQSEGTVLSRMVTDSRKTSHYGGVAYFSYSSLFNSNVPVMETEKNGVLALIND